MSISGQPGLFKLVAEAKNSIIVESLVTGKRMPAYSTSKISALEDIAIFTTTSEVPLKVLPEYDKDRVYVSDMKKVIQWYNLLQSKELLNFDEESETDGNMESESEA